MITARAFTFTLGFTLTAATKAMTSVATTTSSEHRGLHAAGSRDAATGSPLRRLQRLVAVPGSSPNRVNDLLLLRPETSSPSEGHGGPDTRGNRHAVFFHGDIQVRRVVIGPGGVY